MKCLKKYFLVLAVAILLAASCASGSEGEQAPAPTPDDGAAAAADPTATPAAGETEVPVEEATATAEPIALSEEDMIEAALAAFEANPEPETLIAWDHLDARVSGDEVMLTMCTWTGDTVFDDVRTANYTITPSNDGTPKTRFNFSTRSGIDECLNTELIESALAFTREFDTHWQAVLDDPTTFDPEEAALFKTAEQVDINTQAVEGWIRDDLHWEGGHLDAQLPNSALLDILGRRFVSEEEEEFFELIACRNMDERYGLYKGATLVDNAQNDSSDGSNSIIKYQLSRLDQRWLLIGLSTNVWADCFAVEPNWLEGVDEWQPDPVSWQIVMPSG